MRVDGAQPLTPKAPFLNKIQNLIVCQVREHAEVAKELENVAALLDRPQSQLLDNERVTTNLVSPEQLDKRGFRRMKVVDPYRRVDQDHALRPRRRGAAVADGSEPPSAASRRALSTRINVSRPSRTSADFSRMPVRSDARSTSASSSVIVVLTITSHTIWHQLMTFLMLPYLLGRAVVGHRSSWPAGNARPRRRATSSTLLLLRGGTRPRRRRPSRSPCPPSGPCRPLWRRPSSRR